MNIQQIKEAVGKRDWEAMKGKVVEQKDILELQYLYGEDIGFTMNGPDICITRFDWPDVGEPYFDTEMIQARIDVLEQAPSKAPDPVKSFAERVDERDKEFASAGRIPEICLILETLPPDKQPKVLQEVLETMTTRWKDAAAKQAVEADILKRKSDEESAKRDLYQSVRDEFLKVSADKPKP